MEFSSLVFLFLFLPAALLLHFLSPKKLRNPILLILNLLFYGYGEPRYILLMVGSIVGNFLFALFIDHAERKVFRRCTMITAVTVNLLSLGWFKYAGLFTETLQTVPIFSGLPVVSVVLPIGISFYTFQAMSYVIDVYRRDHVPSRNIVDFATYISLFPQLIAGPIVRYSDVASQLRERNITMEKFSWGVRMFCIGLAKKVLLANQFALLWEQVSVDPLSMGTIWSWCAIAAYSMQIYFDFSGYSDMARGLGAMFGFDFCVNFEYPYISRSITEFWRRWHMSLSTWFRDYVYIPLGGSKCGTVKMIRNLMIVWMLTGFWHGAGWNFLFWGFYYGVLLVLEKFVFRRLLKKLPALVGHLITLILVMIGWVFFACVDLDAAWQYLRTMFIPSSGTSYVQLVSWLPLTLIGLLACTPFVSGCWKKNADKIAFQFMEMLLCLLALILCAGSLASGAYNPFIYFRF